MDLGIDHMRSFLDHLSPDNYLVAIVDGKIVGEGFSLLKVIGGEGRKK